MESSARACYTVSVSQQSYRTNLGGLRGRGVKRGPERKMRPEVGPALRVAGTILHTFASQWQADGGACRGTDQVVYCTHRVCRVLAAVATLSESFSVKRPVQGGLSWCRAKEARLSQSEAHAPHHLDAAPAASSNTPVLTAHRERCRVPKGPRATQWETNRSFRGTTTVPYRMQIGLSRGEETRKRAPVARETCVCAHKLVD